MMLRYSVAPSAVVARPGQRKSGFTLVELLVVIGIIAILISVLLPALRRARQSAEQVQCLSNMRQIASATIQFANDHKGMMPCCADFNVHKIDPYSGVIRTMSDQPPPGDPEIHNADDWISWSRHPDPITPAITNSAPDFNITYSALAPYLNAKHIETNLGDAKGVANANPSLETLFRCPGDNFYTRDSAGDTSHGFYRYSYAINICYANPVYGFPGTDAQGRPYQIYPSGYKASTNTRPEPRVDGMFNGKITSIVRPAEKVLYICEDEHTLDDGNFTPDAYTYFGGANAGSYVGRCDVLSSRHDITNKTSTSNANPNAINQDCKGNVVFADGHGEFFTRKNTLRARYSGSPVADPPGMYPGKS
jgi:prepilin-type N-terminal cleavage/methylation domain-containing protein/prepilin-type processing-associated H-X9-DG protein